MIFGGECEPQVEKHDRRAGREIANTMNSESDEPQKKRLQLNSQFSPTMSPTSKTVDVAVLHFENQRLVQQSDEKRKELQDFDAKINILNCHQVSYDDDLIKINRLWNQLDDDLILLGVRSGGGPDVIHKLDHADYTGGSVPSCSPGDMFLCRLLGVESIQVNKNRPLDALVEQELTSRRCATLELMASLQATLDCHREKIKAISESLAKSSSLEDIFTQVSRMHDMLKAETDNFNWAIDVLRLKEKEYTDAIQNYKSSYAIDETEIKRLEGEREEMMIELEETRRKLINLRMQKEAATKLHSQHTNAVNGSLSPENQSDKLKGVKELKAAIEEARILSDDRLSELQEFREENNVLSKELESIQNEIKDDKHVLSSRLYNLVNDQFQYLSAEAERYKALLESYQVERSVILRREKELGMRLESFEASRNAYDNTGSKIVELEQKLNTLVTEKNNFEIEMEEALQDSGSKDIKVEFQVMASALSKEMSMTEDQRNRWKDTAEEAFYLRELQQSLELSLSEKIEEERLLVAKCADQDKQINNLKDTIEKAQKELAEKQIIVDMHAQDGHDNRDIQEIKTSESRALQQAEELKKVLAEHSLELRVKAANEAKAACQERLAAAEVEISEIRSQLFASERNVLEVKEAIKIKDREAEAYISEIETIGQAYEDMQTQNHNLLQLLAARDEYNIKLVAESVKMKQTHNTLLSEKQTLAKQLQQYNTSIEAIKANISQYEEQVKARVNEGMKVTDELIQLGIAIEYAKWELMESEKELKWAKHVSASSEKEDEQIQKKIDEACKELEFERMEKAKLNEEIKKMNDMVVRLTSETGEAAILRLQDEIKECKSILKCSVCSDRPKEVVIVKCYHLFCNPCIQRNLEIRHRKCPACGTAFGQNDVRFVKI